jgi:NAD(P)-dependent dehydrogenase (short-subunit alcohol dehydrogenase family)
MSYGSQRKKTMTITKPSTSEGPALDPQRQQCKVTVVTGASRGVGLDIARKLIAKGYRVIANSRQITSSTLPENDYTHLVSGDIGKPNVAEQAVDAAIRKFGRIDLLVNNARVFIAKPYTVEDFRSVIETNLAGVFHVSQSAVAQMRAQKTGHVVNITASMANQPFAGLPAALCSLSKGGLESVTRALAIEYAGDGIRFNAIAPGVVNTPMHSPAAHDFLRRLTEATEEDIARTCIFGPEWPNVPMRVIRNRVVREWEGNDAKTPPQPDPPQTIGKTMLGGREYSMPKFAAILPTPETTGDFEEMCLAAGESAALVTTIGTARAVVQMIAKEAEQILERERIAVTSLSAK